MGYYKLKYMQQKKWIKFKYTKKGNYQIVKFGNAIENE